MASLSEQERETDRLRMIADRFNLQTVADLDAFLGSDSKTAQDAEARAKYRAALQDAVPRLKG